MANLTLFAPDFLSVQNVLVNATDDHLVSIHPQVLRSLTDLAIQGQISRLRDEASALNELIEKYRCEFTSCDDERTFISDAVKEFTEDHFNREHPTPNVTGLRTLQEFTENLTAAWLEMESARKRIAVIDVDIADLEKVKTVG